MKDLGGGGEGGWRVAGGEQQRGSSRGRGYSFGFEFYRKCRK